MEASVTSAVRVRPVTGRRDTRRFIDLPFELYRENPFWVPQLRSDVARSITPGKNAFFEHGKIQLFLAEDAEGHVVGRVGAIVNGMHLKKYDDGVGFFGFFECVEQYEVAEALLDAAAAWLRNQGLTAMRGPANPSLNDICGLLVEGFDREPSIMMPYNPAYYADFLARYGFERVMSMSAYYIHKKYVKLDRLRRGVALLRRRKPEITLRTLDMSRYDEEARTILNIYNKAWENNWGHVPMTDNEFAHLAHEMKQIVDPKIVYLMEDQGTPIAFSLSLPNINLALKHVRDGRLVPGGLIQLLARAKFGGIYEVRTLLMGILPRYRNLGLDAILHLAIMDDGPPLGYDASEMSWVLDSNHVLINMMDSFGGVFDKKYAMLERTL